MSEIIDTLVNTSLFIIPVWFGDIRRLRKDLQKDNQWTLQQPEETTINYLMRYAGRIVNDADKLCIFRKTQFDGSHLYVCEDLNSKYRTEIIPKEIKFIAFGTGVGFIEVRVCYGNLSLDEICNFIYIFKRVVKAQKAIYGNGLDSHSLLEIVEESVPSYCDLFFYNCVNKGPEAFKNDCIGYHFLRFAPPALQEEQVQEYLFRLRRGIGTAFPYDRKSAEDNTHGRYDFTYNTNAYQYWSGCQEGLVCLINLEPGIDRFIDTHFADHMMMDYHIMYLMLLNQRFAAIRYVEQIALGAKSETKELNRRTTELKTVYSFRIISGDLVYQNIYNRMYRILDIDDMLEDIKDNENRVQEIRSHKTDTLLLIIAVLSISSTLIDMTTYLQLWSMDSGWSLWARICSMIVVFIAAGIWVWNNKKKY